MRVLLPPSESKRPGGGNSHLRTEALAFASQLGDTRRAVREALTALSMHTETAAKALKLGVKAQREIEHNLELETSATRPAVERYDGVLYESFGYDALEPGAQSWVAQTVLIQSALFGLVSASDEIPRYRLSASSTLETLGSPLRRVWSAAHGRIDWEPFGLTLDLRSQDYARLAPAPTNANVLTLHVAQRGYDGVVRALNHFNKAAKGDLVRRLAMSEATLHTQVELLEWAAGENLDLSVDAEASRVTLFTSFGAPARV